MSPLKALRSMPLSVLGLVAVFLLVPCFSLVFLDTPGTLVGREGWLKAGLLILCYWGVPLMVAVALIRVHHWFLPLYLAQCVLLTLHTVTTSGQTLEIQMARVLLIGLMVYVGVLFGNRNFLYPLLTRQFRFWRRAVRYKVGREIFVTGDGSTREVPGLLFDCSTNGAQLSFHPEDAALLPSLGAGAKLTLLVPGQAEVPEHRLALTVAWHSSPTGEVRVGCRAVDRRAMGAYVKTEVAKSQATLRLPELRNYTLIEQDIQETALVLWLVCIALSFALPAFG